MELNINRDIQALNNLLEEARTSELLAAEDLSRLPVVQIGKVDWRKPVKTQINAAFINIENVNELIVKLKPELDDFEFENVPLNVTNNSSAEERIKQEPTTKQELILPLENGKRLIEKDGKFIIENHHQIPNASFARHEVFIQEGPVKIEPMTEEKNVFENMYDNVFENWQIKNGEVDIKADDLKQNEARHKEPIPNHGLSVKFETSEEIKVSEKSHEIIFEDWEIKNEELDIKEQEDLKQTETGILASQAKHKTRLLQICHQPDQIRKHNFLQHDRDYQTIKKSKPETNIRHGKVNMFKCDQCEYQSIQKSNLKTHQLQHKNPEEVNMFKCDQCEFQTIHKHNLKTHHLQHKNPEEVNMFKCNQCEFQTIRKFSLNQHLLRHKKPGEVNMFKCDQCEFQTVQKRYLNRHLLRHRNPEEIIMFKCDQCEYQTIEKSNLKKHVLRHMNPEKVNMFKCDQCEFQTIHKRYLKIHLLRHSDPETVNMFKCDQCEYQTVLKRSLKKHVLQHMNPEEVNMFKCDQCEFQTIHKRYINTHLLRHSDPEKVNMLKCDQCEFQTIHKCSLKTHLLRHQNPEEVNMIKCDQCTYQTVLGGSLKKHVLRHMNPEYVFKNGISLNMKPLKCYLNRHRLQHK